MSFILDALKKSETDRQRQSFVKDHFLKDPADPHHYDLVLNTSTWSVSDCLEASTGSSVGNNETGIPMA